MISIGYTQSEADPCLYTKDDKIFIGTYVDDNIVIGEQDEINEFIDKVKKKGLGVTVSEGMKDYLSCEVLLDYERRQGWIGQPHMVSKVKKTFGDEVHEIRMATTPGTPGKRIKSRFDEEEAIEAERQSRYRSGVGMLLFLVKHSRPDISNAVRELSKCMGKANEEAYREMLRVLKYVIETSNYGLRLNAREDKREVTIETFVDAEWAGDEETRLSVSGYVMFLNGSLINWRSRAQQSVTLSSCESEYVSLAEAVRDLKYCRMMCEGVGLIVKLPMIVRIDNVGAKFTAETANATRRSRHIDVKYHFVREEVANGTIILEFVKSEQNVADIFTKNVNKLVMDLHKGKLVSRKPEKQKDTD